MFKEKIEENECAMHVRNALLDANAHYVISDVNPLARCALLDVNVIN